MVGSTLKQYAREHGLSIQKGIAFGVYQGYLLSMQEGLGWKTVTVAADLSDAETRKSITAWLESGAVSSTCPIQHFGITPRKVTVQFREKPGVMRKISAFIEAFLAELTKLQIHGAQYCNFCGKTREAGELSLVLVNDTVYLSHKDCAEEFNREMRRQEELEPPKGSVITGSLGALLGGMIGAIPWAIFSFLGWFVGWFGFLIGWGARKGYELCKGKETRWKAVCVIVATALIVVLAELATYFVALTLALQNDAELSQWTFTFADKLRWFFTIFARDSHVRNTILLDIVLGWAFAALNISFLVKDVAEKTGKNHNRAVPLE